MPTITIRNTGGSTSTVTAAGSSGCIYAVGPPQSYTVKNFSANFPGAYLGLYILEQKTGPDGNAWYRWDSDSPQDDQIGILTGYTLTYAP